MDFCYKVTINPLIMINYVAEIFILFPILYFSFFLHDSFSLENSLFQEKKRKFAQL